MQEAVDALEQSDHQAVCFTVLGHKADLGVMTLGADIARLYAFQRDLINAGLILEWSYVSVTDLSEYSTTERDERDRLERQGLEGAQLDDALEEWQARHDQYQENRLHPRLPARRAICFYPMSKRRDPGANWYALPFDERKRLMLSHGKLGRKFAGRVLQLITSSTGLDDWEWGVTLFADDPVAIKEIVYEMRFDEISVQYAEFGPFIFGLIETPQNVCDALTLQG